MKVYSQSIEGPFSDSLEHELLQVSDDTQDQLIQLYTGNVDFLGISVSDIRPVTYKLIKKAEHDSCTAA